MRQLNKSTRRLAAGALIVVAGPMAVGSAAYACQRLATLKVVSGSTSVQAGQSVQLFGKNYTAPSSTSAPSDIEIHLDSRTGPVLARTAPAATFNNLSVTIPAGTAAGEHTLIATEYTTVDGPDLVTGAPGRVSINVGGVAARVSGNEEAISAATPAEATVSTPAAAAPAAAAASPSAATAPAVATTGAAPAAPGAQAPATSTASVADASSTPAAAAASTATAADAPSTPAAGAAEVVAPVPTAGSATTSTGFLPASSSSSSTLPGLSLAAALAMVLLALGAVVKTGRSITGRSGSLAG